MSSSISNRAYLVSFPKSGRTWLRLLIGKVLSDHLGWPTERLFDTAELTRAAGLPALEPTHDHSSIIDGLEFDRMPAAGDDYANSLVIFLARDIRDLMVSCYFQATRRLGLFSGSITEFVRSDRYGARKAITFYNLWHRRQEVSGNILLLRYEDMHADPSAQLGRVLAFLGMPEITSQSLDEAIEYGRFEHMKKLEQQGVFSNSPLLPGNKEDPESYKTRRGVVGGYEDYLSASDIDTIEAIVEEIGCPFQRVYSGPGSARYSSVRSSRTGDTR